MPITLPLTKQEPLTLSPRVILLYGAPKVGKTKILTELEDNLIIDFERGTEQYAAMNVKIDSYAELNELLVALATKYKENGNKPIYKYISIDTLDMLEDLAVHKAAELYGQTSLGATWYAANYSAPGVLKPHGDRVTNLDRGAGYGFLREALKWYMAVFSKFAERLILIAHVKDKRLKTIDGVEEIVTNDISLMGQNGKIVAAYASAIGYLYRNAKGELMISFQTSENGVMGARSEHLRGQKFKWDGWDKIFID